jgi:hypothetical protein
VVRQQPGRKVGTNVGQPTKPSENDFSAVYFVGTTRGHVYAEAPFSDTPEDRRRLPINYELIDSALTVQTESGRQPSVNYETAQSNCANSSSSGRQPRAGLCIGPEPFRAAQRVTQPAPTVHCIQPDGGCTRRTGNRWTRRTGSGCTRRTRCTTPLPPGRRQRPQSDPHPGAPRQQTRCVELSAARTLGWWPSSIAWVGRCRGGR